MGSAEAIQTGVVYFQRYHCLSLSVAGADPGRGRLGRLPPLKTTKITLFTLILCNTKNNIHDIWSLFRPLHCHSCIVAYSRYLRNEWTTDIRNELSNLGYCQKSPVQSFFFFSLVVWGLTCCWRRVHQTQIRVALKKVWELLILAILAPAVEFSFSPWVFK